MPVQLYLAPAASGKTTYVLRRAREAALGLQCTPRVVVSSRLQVRACRRTLANTGGAIGVQVSTFDQLYADCLKAAGEAYAQLSEPVQYRLIRALVEQLNLVHYKPLRHRPGFVQVLQRMFGELKAARIWPDRFAHAVIRLGDEPRLRELAQIYSAYQAHLHQEGWADWAGMAWLAVEALEERAPEVARDWQLLLVDGFDDFTEVQIALLQLLAGRVNEVIITLTGCQDGDQRPLVHRRFCRTLARLQEALGVEARPLPDAQSHLASALKYLEQHLYRDQPKRSDAAGALELLEVADRAAEVREGLRWLKERLLQDGLPPSEVALLARDVSPYRPFVLQTAREFGLPIHLARGQPLASNPAIAALLDLLRLMLPQGETDPQPNLPRRLLVEAWRSPYFDWSARPADGAVQSICIEPGDADALDRIARWGQVISGLRQWQETLALAASLGPGQEVDEERGVAAEVPVGSEAEELWAKLRRFVQRITPPQGNQQLGDLVRWLEKLIGDDPQLGVERFPRAQDPTSLRIVERVRQVEGLGQLADMVDWDVAALRALKDVLRGLVWAQEAVSPERTVDFAAFFAELEGAVRASSYRLPMDPRRDRVLLADVVQARGLPFRAVAVLGLAEGEFPGGLSEDPFLRDADRLRMREKCGLPLESSTASAEAEFFYETITRARDRLLLTRPRLADSGAPWQPSPFWEELREWIDITPQTVGAERVPEPDQVASWTELLESLAVHAGAQETPQWARQENVERCAALDAAVRTLTARLSAEAHGPFVGDLTTLGHEFAARYSAEGHVWSASRLEAYLSCPFHFFVAHVLGLEPRPEPQEGLDARQLGNIYHRIFERVYAAFEGFSSIDVERLLAALPEVSACVLDEAPRREGFLATAWWKQTRDEIIDNVRRSLQELHKPDVQQGFVPIAHEQGFFEPLDLCVREGEDAFRLHGVIDRVEHNASGQVRIIDYKTAGPWSFTNAALTKGKKIQLPLYALAARDALGLGEPVDGFYWHVRQARASPFTLRNYAARCGEDPLSAAVAKAWEAVRGAREGRFVPQVPDGGCPRYCPALAFCCLFRAGFGG
jgi:ATP-dependent helicase/nuclease subunit B